MSVINKQGIWNTSLTENGEIVKIYDSVEKNLLSKYCSPGQQAPTATSGAGRTSYYGDYGIKIPATENADTYFRLFLTEPLVSGQTYTISCSVENLLSGSYYNFPLFAQGNTSMGVLSLNKNGICSLTFTMNSSSQPTVTADGKTLYICFMDDSARAIASGQTEIIVKNFKIEKGNTATAWVPSQTDGIQCAKDSKITSAKQFYEI